MADGRAGVRHLWLVVSNDVFPPQSAVVGAHGCGRLDHRLATESAARDDPRTSHAQASRQRGDWVLAPLALAALCHLPLDPPRASPGLQSHRSFRGSGKLLLERGRLERTRTAVASGGASANDALGASYARPRVPH